MIHPSVYSQNLDFKNSYVGGNKLHIIYGRTNTKLNWYCMFKKAKPYFIFNFLYSSFHSTFFLCQITLNEMFFLSMCCDEFFQFISIGSTQITNLKNNHNFFLHIAFRVQNIGRYSGIVY